MAVQVIFDVTTVTAPVPTPAPTVAVVDATPSPPSSLAAASSVHHEITVDYRRDEAPPVAIDDSRFSFTYTGRHDHGPLPPVNTDSYYWKLEKALVDVKAGCLEWLKLQIGDDKTDDGPTDGMGGGGDDDDDDDDDDDGANSGDGDVDVEPDGTEHAEAAQKRARLGTN